MNEEAIAGIVLAVLILAVCVWCILTEDWAD
jgi:hypothetical protein